MFSSLSNTKLVETYFQAVELKLDDDFISLLKEEIEQRGIEIEKVNGRA